MLGQPLEGLDSFLGADTRIAAAVNERERLRDKLQLADTAVAEFEIALDHRGRAKFRFHLMLHCAQLTQGVEIEIAAINEAAEFVEELASELNRSGHRAGPQQRRAFPSLSEILIEAQRAIEGDRQRRVAATRTQPHIDSKASGGKQLGDDFANPRSRDTSMCRDRGIENVNQ